MNQSNNQQVRQVTQEEIEQAQGRRLTQEELQKTQVLNLQDVEEVARFEKRTSKKPAIVVAVIGILLVLFGGVFQITDSLSSKKDHVIEKRDTKEEVIENTSSKKLTCTYKNLNGADGTDIIYTISYEFEEEKLIAFTKNINIMATEGSEQGPITIQNYITAYQEFMNPIDGYEIELIPNNNGITVNVHVDYLKLNLENLNPKQSEHYSTKIDYPVDTLKTIIQSDMLANGYTCE